MRIIHVVPAISEEASGPSYTVVRLCESLIEQGLEVTLATLDWAPSISYPSFVKTFPLGLGPRRLGCSPKMAKWLYEMVTMDKVDIIHNHGTWQMNSIYPARTVKKGRTKLIISPRGSLTQWAMTHGSKLKKIFWPLLQRPAFERASIFHATSELEYEDIRKLGFDQPIAIIPNGIDIPSVFHSKSSNSDLRILLFLGRIHPKKGLDLLLSAWKQVQDFFPEWRLVIAGSDRGYYGINGYLNKMKIMAHDLELKRIDFIGEVYGSQKWMTYKNADLFVLPTYSENFGIAVAEALAAGTPAIVTKGAPWDILPKINAGWWIDMGLEPLVSCLKEALSQPRDKLKEMGSLGRKWIKENYSWERVAKMMDETYHWFLEMDNNKPDWIKIE